MAYNPHIMQKHAGKLKWGIGLLTLAYVWLMENAVLSLIYKDDPTVHHKSAPDTSVVSIALCLVELIIVLVPLRRGVTWAFWAVLLPLLVVGIPRLLTDSACQLYDLSHHGCHQFMAALTLAIISLILCSFAVFSKGEAASASA